MKLSEDRIQVVRPGGLSPPINHRIYHSPKHWPQFVFHVKLQLPQAHDPDVKQRSNTHFRHAFVCAFLRRSAPPTLSPQFEEWRCRVSKGNGGIWGQQYNNGAMEGYERVYGFSEIGEGGVDLQPIRMLWKFNLQLISRSQAEGTYSFAWNSNPGFVGWLGKWVADERGQKELRIWTRGWSRITFWQCVWYHVLVVWYQKE